MMGWYGPDGGPIGWLAMAISMVLFLVVIVAVAWAVIRLAAPSQAPRTDASLETLRERFARGEVSQSEFEEAKRILGLK
jgi:putative membrane protein